MERKEKSSDQIQMGAVNRLGVIIVNRNIDTSVFQMDDHSIKFRSP